MKKLIIVAAAAIAMTACNNTTTNPFLEDWTTPYGIPPFDKIKVTDYVPAVKVGIEEQLAEVQAIIDNPDAPTFENTIAAYDRSGMTLAKVTGVLYNVSETESDDALTAVMDEVTPLMTDLSNAIMFNKDLYLRVKAVYDADQSSLTKEQQIVLKKIYDGFVDSGIGLDEAAQNELKDINGKLAVASNKFGNNLLAENNAFKAEFGISVSSYTATMTSSEDRDLRERMFKAYSSRGHNGNENDNRQLCTDILALKTRQAQIMGYPTTADFILKDKMAHDPQTVDTFLDEIIKASMKAAKKDIKDMQKIMDEDIAAGKVPAGSTIQPWDWFYYAEKLRLAKYNLDESVVSQYFSMENVRKGIFEAAHMLYGINVEPLENVPVYNPAVETFKVTDADGSLLGIFTTDYFPRSTKRGGAWMNNIREQYVDENGNDVRPIIVNVGNLTAPTDTTPGLFTIDEVETAFHEFGHALHGLLTKCHYRTVSGTNVTRDFVETFSQFNENWAFQPEVLAKYAFHYKTGELIPDELVEKINNSRKFNQGFMTGELAAASILDMKLHETPIAVGEDFDIDAFEKKVCKEMGLIDEIIPRYRTTYFNHIFNSGYSAGYYGYLYTVVLEKDAFEYFQQNGTFNAELAKSFKETFLEKGGSEEPMVLYKQFRGAEPDPKALLRSRGLLD